MAPETPGWLEPKSSLPWEKLFVAYHLQAPSGEAHMPAFSAAMLLLPTGGQGAEGLQAWGSGGYLAGGEGWG